MLDMHTIIATEMLGQIKARSLDSFYALEETLLEGRALSADDRQTLSQLLDPTGGGAEAQGGTAEDRLRLLLLVALRRSLQPGRCAFPAPRGGAVNGVSSQPRAVNRHLPAGRGGAVRVASGGGRRRSAAAARAAPPPLAC